MDFQNPIHSSRIEKRKKKLSESCTKITPSSLEFSKINWEKEQNETFYQHLHSTINGDVQFAIIMVSK